MLFAMFVALLMAGCGDPDLDDKETLDEIIAEAIDEKKLQKRGEPGEEQYFRPNEQTPYTGWAKNMRDNGQIEMLAQFKDGKIDGLQARWHRNGQKKGECAYKDGKVDGLETWWYPNGQKKTERTYKDYKLITAVAWKPNGEKSPDTNVVNGNGVRVWYNDYGTELSRQTYKDGELVRD